MVVMSVVPVATPRRAGRRAPRPRGAASGARNTWATSRRASTSPPPVFDVFPLALLALLALTGVAIGAVGAFVPAQRAARAPIAPVLQAE